MKQKEQSKVVAAKESIEVKKLSVEELEAVHGGAPPLPARGGGSQGVSGAQNCACLCI